MPVQARLKERKIGSAPKRSRPADNAAVRAGGLCAPLAHLPGGCAQRFLNADQVSEGYFSKAGVAGQQHPTLSGFQPSDGSREYGLPIAGTWQQQVQRTLSSQ